MGIDEGTTRKSKLEFKQFLHVALGRLAEVETQLIISINIGYLESNSFNQLNEELITIRKMLIGLIKSL